MPSASMQVLEWQPVPEPAATIYTFMGLATIPRLRGGSSLRLLPREMLLKVASFAYSSAFCAAWSNHSLSKYCSDRGVLQDYSCCREGMEPTSVDLTSYLNLRGDDDGSDGSETIMRMSRPIRRGVTFVEIEVGSAWYNTEVSLLGVEELFGLTLTTNSTNPGSEEQASLVSKDEAWLVPEFDDCWEWCETVTFGLLVDMVRGCCTFYLNEQRGPCVKLPGDLWRRHGVQISIEKLPMQCFRHSSMCPHVLELRSGNGAPRPAAPRTQDDCGAPCERGPSLLRLVLV